MVTEWVAKLVVLDDVLENTPPSLETSVDQRATLRNVVDTILAAA
jgi:hypothetical protein